jgi:HAD superfamily hydrolase (TIGR01484 family)
LTSQSLKTLSELKTRAEIPRSLTTFKAFITDIDGTIVSKNEPLSLIVAAALDALRNNNIALIFNTARAFHRIGEDLPGHHLSNPSVTNLGSEIRDTDGKILHIEFIEADLISSLVDIARATSPQSLIAYINGALTPLIYSSLTSSLAAYSRRYGKLGFQTYATIDAFFRMVDKSKLSVIIFRNCDQNPLEHKLASALEITQTDQTTYLITKKGINKQSGILKIAEILDITMSRTEILAAGDALPDDKMFEITTGISVGEIDLPHAVYKVANPEALCTLLRERFI